jgi:magnesium chelatase subunit D
MLFVVDASGSMAAWQRMRQTKAAVLALLVRAYQQRDQVALLAFRGQGTELVLPPARGRATARRALEALPTGGTTPLAHALVAAGRFIRGQRRRQPGRPIWTILLTDGRTNVALASDDPWHDALEQAKVLAKSNSKCLIVNTETGWPRFSRAHALADALQADCLDLEEVLGRSLVDPWRRAI